MLINRLSNQYYVYLNKEQKPVAWNPPNPSPLAWVDYSYFGKVFHFMEKTLKVSGLIFYFTWDCVDELPSYGKNVIAVVVGDEWSRIPKYSHKVMAVFKCYGKKPILECNPFYNPSYLKILTLVKFLQVKFLGLPGLLNYLLNGSPKNIYDLPLGYYRQSDLPIKDINKRKYDVFFAGSITNDNYSKWNLKYWFGTPKSCSRKKMVLAIEKLKQKHPEIKVELVISSSFASGQLKEEDYSEKLMNSKICLVPRGTTLETFRFFEAMRYGCIVIGESLPKRWFYDGSPAIQVNDWSGLEILLPRLIQDKKLLKEKHRLSLNWWRTKCSEEAVGNYIANKISSLESYKNK